MKKGSAISQQMQHPKPIYFRAAKGAANAPTTAPIAKLTAIMAMNQAIMIGN